MLEISLFCLFLTKSHNWEQVPLQMNCFYFILVFLFFCLFLPSYQRDMGLKCQSAICCAQQLMTTLSCHLVWIFIIPRRMILSFDLIFLSVKLNKLNWTIYLVNLSTLNSEESISVKHQIWQIWSNRAEKHEAAAVPGCHIGTAPIHSPHLTPRLSNTGLWCPVGPHVVNRPL